MQEIGPKQSLWKKSLPAWPVFLVGFLIAPLVFLVIGIVVYISEIVQAQKNPGTGKGSLIAGGILGVLLLLLYLVVTFRPMTI